jgi:hypothetical protein
LEKHLALDRLGRQFPLTDPDANVSKVCFAAYRERRLYGIEFLPLNVEKWPIVPVGLPIPDGRLVCISAYQSKKLLYIMSGSSEFFSADRERPVFIQPNDSKIVSGNWC